MNIEEEDMDRQFGPGRAQEGDESDDSHWRSFSHHERDGGRDGSHEMHSHTQIDHGGGLDWGPSAWGEAGGYDHVVGGGLSGPLAANPAAADTGLPGQNHVAETTSVLFETTPGGTIDVGGNVEALGSQSTALNASQSHDTGGFLHSMQVETTNIIFDVASGGTIDIGGSVEALGSQTAALNASQSHAGGFLHNMQVETTNIIFDVASGGSIDIGGNVEALGNQSTALNASQSHDSQSHNLVNFLHNMQVETTNIIFDVASGGAIDVGGNVEALGNQSLAGASSHTLGFLQNTQVETTNIIFNVATGGTIDIGGNVEAASTQQSLVDAHHAAAGFGHFA